MLILFGVLSFQISAQVTSLTASPCWCARLYAVEIENTPDVSGLQNSESLFSRLLLRIIGCSLSCQARGSKSASTSHFYPLSRSQQSAAVASRSLCDRICRLTSYNGEVLSHWSLQNLISDSLPTENLVPFASSGEAFVIPCQICETPVRAVSIVCSGCDFIYFDKRIDLHNPLSLC